MSKVSIEDRIIALVSDCAIEEAERRVSLAKAILKQRQRKPSMAPSKKVNKKTTEPENVAGALPN